MESSIGSYSSPVDESMILLASSNSSTLDDAFSLDKAIIAAVSNIAASSSFSNSSLKFFIVSRLRSVDLKETSSNASANSSSGSSGESISGGISKTESEDISLISASMIALSAAERPSTILSIHSRAASTSSP